MRQVVTFSMRSLREFPVKRNAFFGTIGGFSQLTQLSEAFPSPQRPGFYDFQPVRFKSSVPSQRLPLELRAQEPVDGAIEEMVKGLSESAKSVLKRIHTGDISYGSIGEGPHADMAEAMNRIAMALNNVSNIEALRDLQGFKGPFSSSGEGGLPKSRRGTRFENLSVQFASGRFGVDAEYLGKAKRIVIKINQGAKPGVGGELPGSKVTLEIAETRLVVPGTTLISPALAHDVSSIEDLKRMIIELRSANPHAQVVVKLVANANIGVVAVGAAKCGADALIIAGPGGTGAAPLTARHEFAMTVEHAIAAAHQALTLQGLRSGVELIASGGIQTPKDIFKLVALGANSVEIGTEALVSLGCVKADVCQTGECPVGIATTNEKFASRYQGKPEDLARLLVLIAKAVAQDLGKYGFSDLSGLVGRVDLLAVDPLSPLTGLEKLLHSVKNPFTSFGMVEKHPGSSYDEAKILAQIQDPKMPPVITVFGNNKMIAVGARMAYASVTQPEVARQLNAGVEVTVKGFPGQSFGFIGPKGLTLRAGHTNDGTAKSLSGGTVIAETAGNYAGYGATSGMFLARFIGDRGLVRYSNGTTMVESAGECFANFMTGGRVMVLGGPQSFPHLEAIAEHEPPVFFRKDLIGPNIGASFTGGTLILPKALYADAADRGYLAESAQKLRPQELSEEDLQTFLSTLERYAQEFPTPFVKALRRSDPKVLRASLCKLEPLTHEIVKAEVPVENLQPAQKAPSLWLPQTGFKEPSVSVSSKGLVDPKDSGKDACGTAVLMDCQQRSSRKLVEDALKILAGMMHRGATGIDPRTGDGCGIALYGLHGFFKSIFPGLASLKEEDYAIAHLALPLEENLAEDAISLWGQFLNEESLALSHRRAVTVNNAALGYLGQKVAPNFVQVVVQKPDEMSEADFEKALTRARLKFECTQQKHEAKIRPHILSATPGSVIYKGFAREDRFGDYFEDFKNPQFMASAAVTHARFATNTLPVFKNIQPLPRLANNGENNALPLIKNLLAKSPEFRNLIGLQGEVDLTGWSDSAIMSMYMDYLVLLGYPIQEIVASTIQPYVPKPAVRSSDFYNLLATPFEGPNASIVMVGRKEVAVVRDKNGFRPQRGVIVPDEEGQNECIYSGSELGPFETHHGQVFDLPPATPLLLNLAEGRFDLYEPTPEKLLQHQRQMEAIAKPLDLPKEEPVLFNPLELAARKLRAGWNPESDQIIQSLRQKSASPLVSMGASAAIGALVKKPTAIDRREFYLGNFSQVTNPPLASKEERNYMSLKTFVGYRPGLGQIGHELARGVELNSPILDNREMQALMSDSRLKTHVLDATFSLAHGGKDLSESIDALVREAITMVSQGCSFLVLSDLRSGEDRVTMPVEIVASFLDDALNRAGLRRKVSVGLQIGNVLIGRDVAQAISIGGVDVINPYLTCIPNPEHDEATSRAEISRYKQGLENELIGFMARCGVSTVSAYRSSKAFSGYGIDADLAQQLGIVSDFGGVGLLEMARMSMTAHQLPTVKGSGRYENQDDSQRSKYWNRNVTREIGRLARDPDATGEADEIFKMTDQAKSKSGQPRHYLKMKAPTVWNEKNPMTVCILGGGASGFYQAKSLLDSKLPVRVVILEYRYVNRFGLVGDGIAPDHEGTKRQAKILQELLDDPRVDYFGGVEVGDGPNAHVSIEELQKTYPCVIDCRGASQDKKLGIQGEHLPQVIPASRVYRAYNGAFNPTKPKDDLHVLFGTHKGPSEVGLIGNGNVAADLVRILAKDPKRLAETSINPDFLDSLRENAPKIIRVFARGEPHKTKISYRELEEIAELNVFMTASFNPLKDPKALPESERKCYEFFAACRNQTPPLGSDGPQIHFHFGHVPSLFAASGQDSVEATFMQGSLPKKYTLRAVVTGIGREAVIDDRIEYRSGWSTGNGGNLRLAQQSVAETTQKITEHFKRGDFHGRTPVLPPEPRHWQLGSPIGNEEQKRILNALEDGMSIRTLKDFHEARRYIRPVQTPDPVEIKVPEVKVELPKPAETSGVDPESVTVFANGETTPRRLKPADGETLLTLLQALDQSEGKKIAPPHSCGGAGICADCVVEVKEQPKSAEAPLKTEEKVLEVSGWKPGTHRLACAIHNPRGMTVQYPPKKNGSRGYSQTALLFGEKPAAQGAEKALECER